MKLNQVLIKKYLRKNFGSLNNIIQLKKITINIMIKN